MAQTTKRLRLVYAGLLAALVAAGVLWAWQQAARPVVRPQLGLMTSLPIYWPEGADTVALIEGEGELPWVRQVLADSYTITPLDTLSPSGDAGADPLAGIDRLLIAQPRGLSPQDNVALDNWVRAGGRLLLVIDPMLTGQYAVPLGDPRHPQSVGLIPPVVVRWGLHINFDERQPLEPRLESYGVGEVPVLLSGEAILVPPGPDGDDEALAARGDCRILGEGVAAECKVGKGRVTLLADASLLELSGPDGDAESYLRQLADFALE